MIFDTNFKILCPGRRRVAPLCMAVAPWPYGGMAFNIRGLTCVKLIMPRKTIVLIYTL